MEGLAGHAKARSFAKEFGKIGLMGFFNHKKKIAPAPPLSAAELFQDASPPVTLRPANPCPPGRKVVLYFIGNSPPRFNRIEFTADEASKPRFMEAGHSTPQYNLSATKVSLGLGMLFLDYLCANMAQKGCLMRGEAGSFAASLCDAFYNKDSKWSSFFTEDNAELGGKSIADQLFGGSNFNRKAGRDRIVYIKPEFLPPERIQIIRDRQDITGTPLVGVLADAYRQAWSLPPRDEFEIPQPIPAKPALEVPSPESPKPAPKPPARPPAPKPVPDLKLAFDEIQFKAPAPEPTVPVEEPPEVFDEAPPAAIPAHLFQITNPGNLYWEDSDPLVNFGNPESDEDVWRLRDACEGVAIFGGVGSGKTSSSGAMLAAEYLRAGFGGLVLTAKTDEVARWMRLCARNGRASDCVVIRPGCPHKLNILQYEIQRPGERVSLTDDLVALLRCLNGVATRSGKHSGSAGDNFWTLAPDKLMKYLFEAFLLAREPVSMERFIRFLNRASNSDSPSRRGKGYFTEILRRAEELAAQGSADDRFMLAQTLEYWTRSFPAIPDVTRGGIIATFEALAELLNGRGIRELLCTDTTFTPEMILSGKVVILDFPLKQGSKGALIVQSAWKLLLQQAIEHRADKGKLTARPVFIWEDEAHEFFSQYDERFQPTARDARAARVILSQNLHNFLSLGHGDHSVYSVLEAMNTHIYHCNPDMVINHYASKKIGVTKRPTLSAPGGLLREFTKEDFCFDHAHDYRSKSVGGFQISEREEWAVRPEEFSKLKKGGDGTSEAILVWMSHQFRSNQNLCCKRIVIEQENRD